MIRLRTIVLLAIACAVALPAVAPTFAQRASAGEQRRPAANRQVVVSAAVSLTEVLQQLAPTYQQATGDQLVLNLGASNTLARQIRFGAGVDVFISADEAQMDASAMQIDASSRVDLLSNQLAIAVPDDRPRTMMSARDLLDPAIRRIAIGDSAAVPAGVYAKQYLQSIGIWPDVARKIVPAGSVRLALAAVESGAADAAIVYHTDVATAARAREALLIPGAEGPRIVYPAAIVRAGKNPAGGRRFLTFLQTPAAAAVFTRAGFIALPAAH
jgi:molybdate transport system substrate-binding protein